MDIFEISGAIMLGIGALYGVICILIELRKYIVNFNFDFSLKGIKNSVKSFFEYLLSFIFYAVVIIVLGFIFRGCNETNKNDVPDSEWYDDIQV